MTWPFAILPLALLWQSNEVIARAVANGGTLAPDYAHYLGITGMFGQVFMVLITMIGGWVHNYGLAVILSVVVVRLMLLPLTRTQIRGMKVMQMLQPVMREIQRHYPNRNDQSAKTMELYSVYKINPLSGCLPMVIQLPILFGVYRALYDPFFAGKSFFGIQLLFPVNVTSARSFGIGPDLADVIDVTVNRLGLQHQIFRIPPDFPLIGGGFWYWPALMLVVVYAATSLLMQRVMRRVNAPHPEFEAEFKVEMKSRDGRPQQPDMAQQMQKQMGLMNLMIFVFAFIFSAGALLYFAVQNLLMALEYTILPRGMALSFDAKEMKAFVRRPPPPLRGGQTEERGGQVQETKRDTASPSLGDGLVLQDDAAINQADDLGAEDTAVPGALRRPRRKKRKR